MGHPATIRKDPADWPVLPKPGGGLNIAYEAVDRHAQGALADHVAFRFLTNRFANVLKALRVGRGERVFVLTGRIPELYTAVLESFKNGCVVSPLFSAFDPELLVTRLKLGEGAVLVTTDILYERNVAKIRNQLPALRHVLLVADEGETTGLPGTHDLASLMAQASDEFEIVATQAEDPALLHFTSGTTGTPKGAMHVHGALPTQAGSPARPTASSRRCCTA